MPPLLSDLAGSHQQLTFDLLRLHALPDSLLGSLGTWSYLRECPRSQTYHGANQPAGVTNYLRSSLSLTQHKRTNLQHPLSQCRTSLHFSHHRLGGQLGPGRSRCSRQSRLAIPRLHVIYIGSTIYKSHATPFAFITFLQR